MTPQERRGKRLFLFLATLIILEKLVGLGLSLSGGLGGFQLFRSVIQSVGFALAVGFLWEGTIWLRWLVGAACVVYGGPIAFAGGLAFFKLSGATPAGATGNLMRIVGLPLSVVALLGLFYFVAGALLLFSPSLLAFFRYQREGPQLSLFETVDALNTLDGGGEPIVSNRFLGKLKLRSGTLVLGDPQSLLELEIPNIAVDEAAISAQLWQYPSGALSVTALTIRFGDDSDAGPLRKIGEVGIDSAKLVVADKDDINEYWTGVGNDRIGVISTGRDETVLRLLTKRFKLETMQVNPVRAEVVGPISDQLEKDIEGFLKSDCRYADYPFLHFHVQTNNSFDRVNHMPNAWGFIPVGNSEEPLLFACETGRGDGAYDVECAFSGEEPRVVKILFIEGVHD